MKPLKLLPLAAAFVCGCGVQATPTTPPQAQVNVPDAVSENSPVQTSSAEVAPEVDSHDYGLLARGGGHGGGMGHGGHGGHGGGMGHGGHGGHGGSMGHGGHGGHGHGGHGMGHHGHGHGFGHRHHGYGWWGTNAWWNYSDAYPWWGLGVRPLWWGTLDLTMDRMIYLNGYYYPYYLYSGMVYPDYSQPYAWLNGYFAPITTSLPTPPRRGAAVPVEEAKVVTAGADLIQD